MAGPLGAPYPEPKGYSAEMEYVKANPLNNDYYVNHWRDNPWYDIVVEAHKELTALVPGYNISQLKDKFGRLRFYIDLPEDTPEDVKQKAKAITAKAEKDSYAVS